MVKKLNSPNYSLHNQDCLKGMKKIDADQIDLVVTSPPYNLAINYNSYKDDMSREAYLSWADAWISEIARTLKNEGSFFLNVGSSPSNPTLPHQIALLACKHFELQNTFHWIKSITVEPRNGNPVSAGHFKPINSYRFVNDCHEYIFHFTPTGKTKIDRTSIGVPYQDKSNVKRWSHTKGKDVRCRGNTWFIPYKTIQSRNDERPHPATYPVQLVENCIKIHGAEPFDTIMDPFAGIGSTALASLNCGIQNFIGFEIDAQYASYAKKIIRDEVNAQSVPAEKDLVIA